LLFGGEGGIRTLDTLLTYTHFPGVRLRPLGHLSNIRCQASGNRYWISSIYFNRHLPSVIINVMKSTATAVICRVWLWD
jgi:hypothetical protein